MKFHRVVNIHLLRSKTSDNSLTIPLTMKQKRGKFIMLGQLEVGKTLVSQYIVECAQLSPLLHKFGHNLLIPQTQNMREELCISCYIKT
jgi:hypothetical protein